MDRFFAFIERMREKPDAERRRFAVGVAFGITLVLTSLWAAVLLPGTFRHANEEVERLRASTSRDLPPRPTAEDVTNLLGEMENTYGTGVNPYVDQTGSELADPYSEPVDDLPPPPPSPPPSF